MKHYIDKWVDLSIIVKMDVAFDEDEIVEIWQNNRTDDGDCMSLMDYVSEAEAQMREMESNKLTLSDGSEAYCVDLNIHFFSYAEESLESIASTKLCEQFFHLKFSNIKCVAYRIETYKEFKQ